MVAIVPNPERVEQSIAITKSRENFTPCMMFDTVCHEWQKP
jgi:hypothetical protein